MYMIDIVEDLIYGIVYDIYKVLGYYVVVKIGIV